MLAAHPTLAHTPLPAQGRWGRVTTNRTDEESPLAWEPVPTLRERLFKSLNIPAMVGIVVFGTVVLFTAGIMIRGLTATPAPAVSEAQRVSTDTGHTLTGETQATDASAVAADAVIFVHVVGEVTTPGVLELSEGSRVADAIKAAGGTTPLAKLEAINLARVLIDGEQVLIPDAEAAEAWEQPGLAGLPDAPIEAPGNIGKINVNTATSEELQQLHRVGPALAQRIIDWRDSNGRFSSVDELLEVSGIGVKTLDQFRDRVSV